MLTISPSKQGLVKIGSPAAYEGARNTIATILATVFQPPLDAAGVELGVYKRSEAELVRDKLASIRRLSKCYPGTRGKYDPTPVIISIVVGMAINPQNVAGVDDGDLRWSRDAGEVMFSSIRPRHWRFLVLCLITSPTSQ